jgi:hypothetical protein
MEHFDFGFFLYWTTGRSILILVSFPINVLRFFSEPFQDKFFSEVFFSICLKLFDLEKENFRFAIVFYSRIDQLGWIGFWVYGVDFGK